MIRLSYLLFFLFIISIPVTGLAAYKQSDLLLPDLEELSGIVEKGTDKEKINILDKFHALSQTWKYWRRDENWLPLLTLLSDQNPLVREESIRFCASLVRHGNKSFLRAKKTAVYSRMIPLLRLALRDADSGIRREACRALAAYKDREAVPLLDKLLDEPDPWIQLEAVRAIGRLTFHAPPDIVNRLIDIIAKNKAWPHTLVQREVLQTLWGQDIPVENRAALFRILKK